MKSLDKKNLNKPMKATHLISLSFFLLLLVVPTCVLINIPTHTLITIFAIVCESIVNFYYTCRKNYFTRCLKLTKGLYLVMRNIIIIIGK